MKKNIVIVSLSFLCAVIILKAYQERTMMQAIDNFCYKYKVDQRIMYALIQAESDGKLTACSKKNCWGLGQVSEKMVRQYYWHRAESIPYFTNIANLPKVKLKKHMYLLYPNIGASTWIFRHCLNQSIKKFGKENYLYAMHLYINGYEDNVAWRYMNNIMDDLIRFGYQPH